MSYNFCLECKSWIDPAYHVDIPESWNGPEQGRWYCPECFAEESWTDEFKPCEECEEIAVDGDYLCKAHRQIEEAA